MSQLDADYAEFIQSAYAESTSKAFLSHSMKFIEFCSAHKLQLYPLSIVNVSRYLTYYCQKVGSFSTVSNVVSSLKKFYALSGYVLDVNNPLIDLLLKAAKRTMSSQSKPIQPAHIILIKQLVDVSVPIQHAFIVSLVFQFFSCVRKSNLLPPTVSNFHKAKCLKRSDIVYKQGSLVVMLPWTKTLQNSQDIYSVCIAKNQSSVLDPVSMYLQFIHMFPMPQSYPAFSFKASGKVQILTQSMYNIMLKQFMEKIGIPSHSFSSHSVRRGSSSLMFESGLDIHLLKHHGTWKSSSYQKYITYNHAQKLLPTQKMYQKIDQMFGR